MSFNLNTELLYPTEFFYNHVIKTGHLEVQHPGKLINAPRGSRCYLCGRKDFIIAYDRDDVIKEGFTNQDNCHLDGKFVCLYCGNVLTHAVRKMYLYLVTPIGLQTNFEDGISLRDILKKPPKPPFLLGLGNFRKHTVFRNRVTLSKDVIYAYIISARGGFDQLMGLERSLVVSIAENLKTLAEALKSTPFAVSNANFGRKRLAVLSQDQLDRYHRIQNLYDAKTPTGWAALQLATEPKNPPKTKALTAKSKKPKKAKKV